MAIDITHQHVLYAAISGGDIDLAIALLKRKPELLDTKYPPSIDKTEGTPLHQAMRSNNNNLIRALLELNPKQPNQLDNEGKTALAYYDTQKERSVFANFFIAVDKGCLVDVNSVRATNQAAKDVLSKASGMDFDKYTELMNEELKEYVVEQLPNPNKNPKAYCGYLLTIILADSVAAASGEVFSDRDKEISATALELIQNEGSRWEQNLHNLSKRDIDGLADNAMDTADAVMRYAVLPTAVRKYGNAENLQELRSALYTNHAAIPFLDPNVVWPAILFENRSISEGIDVVEAYHENLHRIRGSLVEIDDELLEKKSKTTVAQRGWVPLLTTPSIDVPAEVLEGQKLPENASKLMIVELTDKQSLTDEGQAQNNCVGDYSSSCKDGDLRVFSIKTDTGKTLSTLGINTNEDSYSIYQNYGKDNKTPHHTAKLAEKWFVKAINNGVIDTNEISAAEGQNKTKYTGVKAKLEIFKEFGFVPTKENCQKAYELISSIKTKKGKPLFSPNHRYETIEEMDKATGICAMVRDNFFYKKNLGENGEQSLQALQERVDKLKAQGNDELPEH